MPGGSPAPAPVPTPAPGSPVVVPSPGGGGGAVPLVPNAFAFLLNTSWRADAPASTSQPQYWVVRVTGLGPPAVPGGSPVARLLWLQESDVGSGLYRETRRVVQEPVRLLKPLTMQADAAAGGFRPVGGFNEGGRFA
jgi:hypothetical protein